MKFCVPFQVGKVYCVNENKIANPRFAFHFQIFNFSFYHSYITHGHFSSKFSQLGLWNLWQFCLFSERVKISDGYRRGYVSFAHFLLYLIYCTTILAFIDTLNHNPSIHWYTAPQSWHSLIYCITIRVFIDKLHHDPSIHWYTAPQS